ncbi:mechanosensitive ion channel family protein [Rhodobacteraceae bacterium NNCM2]|nr:mechanosensitive ion channel family protein [Coraliihabitans acroporae]
MIRALVVLFLIVFAAPALAQSFGDRLQNWSVQLDEIEAKIDREKPDIKELQEQRVLLTDIKTELGDAIEDRVTQIEPLEEGLKKLGDPPPEGKEEAPRLADERARLNSQIDALAGDIGLAENLELRADTAIDRLLKRRRDIFTDQLMTRSPSIFDGDTLQQAIDTIDRKLDQLFDEIAAQSKQNRATVGQWLRTVVGLAMTAVVLFLIFRLKVRAEAWLKRQIKQDDDNSRRSSIAVSLTLIRLVLPSTALAIFLTWLGSIDFFGSLGDSLVEGSAMVATFVIGAYGLGSAYYAPYEASLRISKADDKTARRAHRLIILLAVIVGLNWLFVQNGVEGLGLSFEALVLINTILLIPGGVVLWMTASILHAPQASGPAEGEEGEEETVSLLARVIDVIRVFVRISAVASPVLAVMGYYLASRYFFYPTIYSGVILGLAILLFHVVHEGVEQFTARRESGEPERIQFIPVIVGFVLTCLAIPALALVWGASPSDLKSWWQIVEEGITIGEVKLSPVDFIAFCLVFSVGYVLTRVVQGVLRRNVLPLTRLDSGGRDAVSAGIGYLGIFISALVAITTTGLDLSNIAIVAGALSVGIGFGLQNIVNNFISGIILLVERPIKAGDWVELTSGMGYVKKVNVRSTEVETFDRASLFVPNSELISNSVINWTHSNMHGRVIVKVGVSYDADPRKVEKVLQGIADAHPMLLKRPTPYVLFRGFGADSLNFEIRGVLRDVNWILNVQSDINYEIARRFKEEGIEIPFAQRVLHIKNASEIGRPPPPGDEEPGEEPTPAKRPRRGKAAGFDAGDADADGDGR